MTMYEPNAEVRPTGAEIEEFADAALPDRTPAAPSRAAAAERPGAGDAGSFLRIYLNDHRAGASGGIALARRGHRKNAEGALGATLRSLIDDFTADSAALGRIADSLEVPENPLKSIGARVAEIVGRVKTNGRLREYSPLSRLLELEALLAGIDAKRSLWRALSSSGIPVPPEIDLHALEQRASEQREALRPFHEAAAADALECEKRS